MADRKAGPGPTLDQAAGTAGNPHRQTDRRQAAGRQGEALAAAYLAEQGYDLEARNWRTRVGELDIVARDGPCLVFVEVRARTRRARGGAPFGTPEESVTGGKQRRLVAMAETYLFQCDWRGPWRIDVLALDLNPDGSLAALRHYRDAVQG